MARGAANGIDSPSEPERRRRRWWLWCLPVALVAVVVGGLVVWSHQAAAYRADFTIRPVGAPTCTGTTVHHRMLDEGPFDVIAARPGMLCTLTVRYANNSPVTLHLGTATYPLLGRGSGLLVTMTGPGVSSKVEGRMVGGRGGPAYDIDATVPLDRDLASGQSFQVDYQLVFHPTGCSDGTSWVSGLPDVDVTALTMPGTVSGSLRIAVSGNYNGCTH